MGLFCFFSFNVGNTKFGQWVNFCSKGQPMRGGPPAWGLGEVLTAPLRKKHMLRITHKLRCFLWRQNNPEVSYSPTRISVGERFRRKYHTAVNEIGTYRWVLGMLVACIERGHLSSRGSWGLDRVGSG